MNGTELCHSIRAVFEPGHRLIPGDIIEHECEECAEVATTFARRTWPEIAAEAIDTHFHSLPLLSPVAFRQFLPAYMVRGLERPDDPWGINEVLQFTTYNLLPKEVDARWRERVDAFTQAQALLIVDFLDHVKKRDKDYDAFNEPTPHAEDYWLRRITDEPAAE
jgi:hypothetical protein